MMVAAFVSNLQHLGPFKPDAGAGDFVEVFDHVVIYFTEEHACIRSIFGAKERGPGTAGNPQPAAFGGQFNHLQLVGLGQIGDQPLCVVLRVRN